MKDFQAIAISQAETLNKQAADIQRLIRDVATAKDEAYAALALAGKYAQQAGVAANEESVRLAAADDAYWRGRLEREHHALEMFHDEIIRNVLINFLQQHKDDGLTGDQVQWAIKHIKDANAGCRRYAEQGRKYHEALGEALGKASNPPATSKRKPRRVETYELPMCENAS